MDMNDSDTLTPKRPVETSKASGGRVPDASVFTDYAAGLAASKDYKNGPPLGKVVLNGSLAGMISISSCGNSISEPTPQTTGVLAANQVQKGASDWIRLNKDCVASGRLAESHEPGVRGVPVFVDDTISVNGVFGIGLGNRGVPLRNDGNSISAAVPRRDCPPANHTHAATVPRAGWSARPLKGAGGLVVPSIPRLDDARKVGGLVPSDHTKYVEKHHGNDFGVNPRRVPIPYQIPAGTPAQLKINDPSPTV
jgi:hypothetical protein